ncbi:probable serine/threonine-protein kinase DDB_G0282963 isoform X4 [Nasonia vitripennis]|uniref:Mediator of DNA damage checkpoint protein 1 n=1 Tax=Nasonia vitripennis TaxID=7425 RepID=A0A7M7QSX6_NASVI|nr:probable serine/threonine-protein kinase DDB_G0282963 isoform X4 [Nasonia vitripennis]
MDLPATQAMSEDEFPATQQVVNNEKEEKTLVGTLLINKQTYSIFSGLTKIGRHPNCEIVLNSETVSKIHAEIEATSPNRPVFIKDLKSSNLTRINRGKLRPYSLYQVTDGNELIFGNVIAIFKLYQPIDDSLVSCTPQVNRKLKAIIPGTPDSSMNTSSASESDNSIIPGTQTDKIDSNFRLPGIPVRSSRSDEHRSPRVPAFTLDDLPSPLSKEKKRHDDICEAKTQRPSTSNETEGHDSSDDIYTAATQKASKIVKPVTSDENIYDMATQRPIDSDEGTDELENVTTQRLNYKYPQSSKVTDNQSINDLETQPFDAEKLNSVKRKSLDASIYSALTQKNVPDNSDNESIEDLETQQFNLANNVSIHSAATQKNDYTKSNSKSIEDLETQAFDTRKSSVFNGDLNDVSIHSAPTQKNVCNEPTETIEDLETQQVDMRKSNSSNNSSHDVSIHSAATQKNVSKDLSKSMENLETQQFDLQKKALKRESYDDSIYSATTQKVNNEAPHEFIENVETQKFDANKPEKFVVPSPFQRECNKSLDVSETERCIPVDNILESIENMETQHFVTTTTSETSTSNKVTDESIHAAEILKLRSAEPNNESIDNLETEQFINKTTNEIIDESTESMHLVDESPRISSLSFTSQNTSPVDLKDTKESSSNAGIQRIEQENEQNNTSENPNNSNLQFKEPLVSSSITYSNTTNTINDKEISVSKSVGNNEEEKSILEGENEEEMFSQNLIEDCPFAFLPEESVSNKNQSSTISQIEEKTKIKENKIINGSIFNASTNTEIHKSEAAASKSHDIINESDSETDEEGVFTNQSSNEDKCNQSSSKYTSKTGKDAVPNEADSETDEEGAFSNHLSNQSEGDVKNSKQNNDKIRENDSETDEEGVFSDRMVKEKKNQSSLSKKDNNVDSDEDIFDNIPDDDGKTELNESVILSSKPDSLIHQDLIFDDNCEEKSTIIKKSHTANTKSFEDNKINDIEVDDLASTQLINTGMTDNFLASTQVISKEKDSAKKTGENFDDLELVPTQKIVDTQYTESQFPAQNSSRRSNDRWNTNSTIDLAPTQKLTDTQLCTESQFATSINKQLNDCSNAVNKLDLASTQIITETQSCTESQFAKPVGKQLNDKCNTEKKAVVAETAPCTELQLATEINDELPNDLINRNADIEDLECKNAPTKDSNDLEQKLSLSQSKRQLEELEITCNKKVKTTDDAQNVQSDLFDNVEKDLGEMFEGPENKPSEVDQSALLTQQLENILESSQNDDSFVTDLNESKPSPTLSSGRISKTKNRRRAMLLGKADPLSPLVKPVINLNDTIERNLNKLFDDNVNNMKAYETDEMMTQQLKSILQSQDDHHMTNNEDITVTKSPVLSKTCEKKKNRLSLSVNLNASSTSKKQAKQQTPKPSCVQPSSSNKTVELQEADEYLANLKSNKTRNATDTLSDEERIHSQSSTDNEREIVYKRGMIGFSSTMRPVSTKEPVALLELKGRSFTSDSQSDGDESSILGHTKRFSLSLSKHVDLNSSLSSLSDQEVGKKLTAKPSTLSLKRTGNKHPSSSSNHPKRVLARGTRGFTSELQPIESEDLVSAASTESDEELRSLPTTSKKEAGDSSKAEGVPKTIQSRMSSLTIIRTKRSVASDVDDAQNRPPKRSKTTPVDEERPKLQQLSPAPVSVADPDKKRVSKVPKTLDSFVVNYNSKNITDSSDTSAIENSVVEETQNEKSNRSQTRGRAAAANRKKTKHEALTVHSNNSSKENLVVENSDVESAPYTSKARNIRLKRNLNITDPSVIKNSSKDEISNSSVESDSKTKKRGRATRQKKAMSVKEPVVTKKVATIIQDSDAEESDESEFLKKESKNKLVETIKSSHSGKSNNSKVIEAESQNEKEKDVEQMISGKSNKSDVNVTKSKRTRRVKESDLEKKDSSLDAVSKKINTRTRRGIKVDNSSLEESSSSDSAATKGNKSDQDKNVKESVLEKFNADVNKTSKNRQIKQADAIKIKSNVEESHEDEVTLDSDLGIPDPSTKPSRSSRATKTNVTLNKGTRSRKANARDQSSDSVFSESDAEKDRNVSLANKSSSSRPVRQTRARKASTNVSTVDTPSSEESQEIAEILQNSSGEEANRSRKRNARRAKNTPNSSEDTQDSESNNTQEDNVFERPVSRPKRARLVKSTKNKSSSQNNLPVDEEIRTRSPQQSSTSQKRTPSPNLPVTPSRSTPSRNRRTMSMSPMKGASYKVLFTGERSEVHRKIVAKLGGSEMEDPEKCSILVTDKVRRTYKFLCCLAQGIPIVSVAWLNDSGKAHRFLNWENYVLQDPTAEAKFKFKLKESLEKASTHRLLEGYTVLITPRITQPPVAELKGMVISSGGKPLVKPTTKWQENTVIITKEDDLQNAKKFMAKAPKSVTMHSTEFILTGILRQELSLEEFKLTV